VAKPVLEAFVTAEPGAEDKKYTTLTAREKEVFRLVAAGQSNREIAEALFLSIRTVEKHRQSAMRKLGLSRREELTRYAIRKGLINPTL
jgi:DNA-binding CsgD family transcriptional regulator